MTLVLCLAVMVVLLASVVQAGDWRRGKYGSRPDFMGKVEDMTVHGTDSIHQPAPRLSGYGLPKNFTWCQQVGQENRCTHHFKQLSPRYCGASYLHATLSMLMDRLKIRKGGPDVTLSRQTFLNCAPFFNMSGGCDGGDPIDVFRWMDEHGLPDESCMPYNATDYTKFLDPYNTVTECPDYGKCQSCAPIESPMPGYFNNVCWPVRTPILYSVANYSRINVTGPAAMMNEILVGPIVCSMAADAPFIYGYRGGIYQGSNSTDVDLNVEVVGWGEEDGVPFWHVRNSFGTFWGELGFFRIVRGTNLLRLEEGDCWYATPTWEMEKEVLGGLFSGSMYGLIKNNATQSSPTPTLRPADADSADIAAVQQLQQPLPQPLQQQPAELARTKLLRSAYAEWQNSA